MVRAYITSAVAGAFLAGLATAALAVTGEFSNMCTMGLASGKDIQTDCSVNAQLQGKTYCFFNKVAMTEFMKDPTGNLAKAQAHYSKI
jgi:YHS domain-containing protein